jgi:hypothetical protein
MSLQHSMENLQCRAGDLSITFPSSGKLFVLHADFHVVVSPSSRFFMKRCNDILFRLLENQLDWLDRKRLGIRVDDWSEYHGD